MESLEIVEEQIPIEVYQSLRVTCGLSAKSKEACLIGLKNSIHSIMVRKGDDIIGMGRIVGDGGCFCQVVDICVLPKYQGQGIGKVIMKSLVDFIKNNLPETCYTSLIADGDACYLYEKFGFQPTLPESRGMYLKRS
ncbi:MAG: GNAT family N-acetyltransferase [Bacteroidota bacterium]